MIDYQPITPDVLEALRGISGKRVITGEDINPDYAHDAMPIYGIGMPEATIDVESTEEYQDDQSDNGDWMQSPDQSETQPGRKATGFGYFF